MAYRLPGSLIPAPLGAVLPALAVAAALGALPSGRAAADSPPEAAGGSSEAVAGGGSSASGVFFVDATAESGLDFVHANGAAGRKNYNEVMGSGAALLDYDGDGRLDVYCVTSVGPNRLWRNLGGFRFEEVGGAAGAADEGYGMGATAGDIDNDGDPDLYVTNFGPNVLFRNDGGRFRRLRSGTEDPRWGTGAALADYDLDGRLDLFVANYVEVAVPDTNACPTAEGHRMYCGPRRYPRTKCVLYRNLGGGTFADVSIESGIAAVSGRGLGVAAFDADRFNDADDGTAHLSLTVWLYQA